MDCCILGVLWILLIGGCERIKKLSQMHNGKQYKYDRSSSTNSYLFSLLITNYLLLLQFL